MTFTRPLDSLFLDLNNVNVWPVIFCDQSQECLMTGFSNVLSIHQALDMLESSRALTTVTNSQSVFRFTSETSLLTAMRRLGYSSFFFRPVSLVGFLCKKNDRYFITRRFFTIDT
jgi:hypothetical protein